MPDTNQISDAPVTWRGSRRAAVIARARLVELFPKCFRGKKVQKPPLKIGIFEDVVATGKWDLTIYDLHCGIADYANGVSYLTSFCPGATRIDLDGNTAGEISVKESLHAATKLSKILKIPLTEAAEYSASKRA